MIDLIFYGMILNMSNPFSLPKISAKTRLLTHHLYYSLYSKHSILTKILKSSGLDESNPNDAYAIVRKSTDDTILINEDGFKLIKDISLGKNLGTIARNNGFTVPQVVEFIFQLYHNGFLKAVDGRVLPDHRHKIHPWFARIPKKYFSWAVNLSFLSLVWLIIIFGLSIGILDYHYWPTYRHFFWTDDHVIVAISLFIIGNLALLLHEAGHFVITRAYGGQARLSFDHRYLFLVAQTSSYYVSYLPLPQRLLIYIAGMVVDLLIISLLYILILLSNYVEILIYIKSFLFAFILIQIHGILWQFNFHLETDIYNTFNDLLGFNNLKSAAKKHWIKLILKLKVPYINYLLLKNSHHLYNDSDAITGDKLSSLTAFKKKIWYFYNILLIIGIIFTTLEFALLILPRELVFLSSGLDLLYKGLMELDIYSIAKSLILFFIVFYKYVFWLIAVIKKQASKRFYGSNPFQSL